MVVGRQQEFEGLDASFNRALEGVRQMVFIIGEAGLAGAEQLVEHAADYSVGVMILLIVCKALAYGLSLSAFRGGPTFPSMFIGAALGMQLVVCPA